MKITVLVSEKSIALSDDQLTSCTGFIEFAGNNLPEQTGFIVHKFSEYLADILKEGKQDEPQI